MSERTHMPSAPLRGPPDRHPLPGPISRPGRPLTRGRVGGSVVCRYYTWLTASSSVIGAATGICAGTCEKTHVPFLPFTICDQQLLSQPAACYPVDACHSLWTSEALLALESANDLSTSVRNCGSCGDGGGTGSESPSPSPPSAESPPSPSRPPPSPSPPPPSPSPPPGEGPPCDGVDVAILLDRSQSLSEPIWTDYVLEAADNIINAVNPGAESNTRASLIVFPATNGNRGDDAGNARTVVSLTSDKASLLSATATGKTACSDSAAATTLQWPCSKWTFTPTHHALIRAQEQLFPNGLSATADGRQKVVVVLTDGVPARHKGRTRFLRSTYLALYEAQLLKEAGALILGIGFSDEFYSLDVSYCVPMCTNGGEEFFAGRNLAGTVYFEDADNSPLGSGNQGNGDGWSNTFEMPSLISNPEEGVTYWADPDASNIVGLGATLGQAACSEAAALVSPPPPLLSPSPSPPPPPSPSPPPPSPPVQCETTTFMQGTWYSGVDYEASIVSYGSAPLDQSAAQVLIYCSAWCSAQATVICAAREALLMGSTIRCGADLSGVLAGAGPPRCALFHARGLDALQVTGQASTLWATRVDCGLAITEEV